MKFDRLSGITGRTIVFRSPETSGMLHPLHISISFPSTISISSKCNTALRNEQHTHIHIYTSVAVSRFPNIDSIYPRIYPRFSLLLLLPQRFLSTYLGHACIEFLGQSCILVFPLDSRISGDRDNWFSFHDRKHVWIPNAAIKSTEAESFRGN